MLRDGTQVDVVVTMHKRMQFNCTIQNVPESGAACDAGE